MKRIVICFILIILFVELVVIFPRDEVFIYTLMNTVGSLILVGGDPGVGKSTLLLQVMLSKLVSSLPVEILQFHFHMKLNF